uniref:Uncharacterized protein n=1 Tax=Hydrogenovibrio crunogenus (strain DSM 25203 / XCL-2) TaxID=317025 RepID=Q31IZ9_HYDCU
MKVFNCQTCCEAGTESHGSQCFEIARLHTSTFYHSSTHVSLEFPQGDEDVVCKKINRQARLTIACISLMTMGAPDALADTEDNLGTQILQTFNAVSGSIKSMFEMETKVSFRTLNNSAYSVETEQPYCCQAKKSVTVVDFLRFGHDKANIVMGLNLVDSNLLISKGDQWHMSLGVKEVKTKLYGSDDMGVMLRFQASLH